MRKHVTKDVVELCDNQQDKDKICYLFFHRLFSIADVESYFKGKYTYRQIKDIINEKYKNF